jgi:hypothetical protein
MLMKQMQKDKDQSKESEEERQLERILTKCIKSHQRVSFKEDSPASAAKSHNSK